MTLSQFRLENPLSNSKKLIMHLKTNFTGEQNFNNKTKLCSIQPLSLHTVEQLNTNSCCSSDISVASGSPGIVFHDSDDHLKNQRSFETDDRSTGKVNKVVNSLMRIVKIQHNYLKYQSSQIKNQRDSSALVSRTGKEIIGDVTQNPTMSSTSFKEQLPKLSVASKRPFRLRNSKSIINNSSQCDVDVSSHDQPPPQKKRRRGGPMAFLNEPSIHDNLNLWILPPATRIAAAEALDLCAIRTQMIKPRRRRAPIATYNPDFFTISKQMKTSLHTYSTQTRFKKCQSKSISSFIQTCCIPVFSNLNVPPSKSSNSICPTLSQRKHSFLTDHSDKKTFSLLKIDTSYSSQKDFANNSSFSSLNNNTHYCDEQPLLITEKTYYLPDFLLDDELQEAMMFTRGEKNVEVPCWRVNDFGLDQPVKLKSSALRPVKKTIKFDLPESSQVEFLDDEVFLKRHNKSEQEEIRRDKRERQRLKELAQREKWEAKQRSLQAKLKLLTLGVSEVNQPSLPNTLAGDSNKGKFPVCVKDKIHVIAFGTAVPSIKLQHFNLPWFSKSCS